MEMNRSLEVTGIRDGPLSLTPTGELADRMKSCSLRFGVFLEQIQSSTSSWK